MIVSRATPCSIYATTADLQANLPATVTEQSLGEFFAKCGPIGTVKIMWRELFRPLFISVISGLQLMDSEKCC
jgi:hypothetical protein